METALRHEKGGDKWPGLCMRRVWPWLGSNVSRCLRNMMCGQACAAGHIRHIDLAESCKELQGSWHSTYLTRARPQATERYQHQCLYKQTHMGLHSNRMTHPSRGVMPMDVSTQCPFLIAATLLPAPASRPLTQPSPDQPRSDDAASTRAPHAAPHIMHQTA